MADPGMGQELWAEALAAAVYVRNRSPHAGRDVTPWEDFTGEKPDVSVFRVWGSKAYALLPDKQQRGINPKTMEGYMVGYGAGGVGYRVMNPTDNTVVVRRDVAIDETGGAAMTSPPPRGVHWQEGIGAPGNEREPTAGGTPAPTPGTSPALTPSSSGTGPTVVAAAPIEDAIAAARRIALPPSDEEAGSEEEEVRRYPVRNRMPPRYWGGGANVATIATAAEGGNVVHRDQLPAPPKDVKEARTRPDWPQWRAALKVEESSMTRNKVWRVADKPSGRRALRTKVILEYKFKQDGTLDRYKARLVALGCGQRPGRDYHETWAPVPSAPTTRALLAAAAARGWHAHHVDVRTAYLNAPMDVDVYLIIPDGFNDAGKTGIMLRAMYGTKQAGRLWRTHLHDALTGMGAVQSDADPCVYRIMGDGHKAIVEAHVDDIVITGENLAAVVKVKAMIAGVFDIRDLGQASDYLGMAVKWDRAAGTVSLSNPRHTSAILADFGMEDCKPNTTPMVHGLVLGDGERLEEPNRYAEPVGSLLFLANQTRPDIAFAVGRLARRMAIPTEGDMAAAKAVVRYLKGTKDMGLVYGRAERLAGWADSDWAGHVGTRKSTTGFVFTLHGGSISWRSRLQGLVTSSTMEAEYVAASEGVKDSLWLRRLVGFMGEDSSPVTIREDNQACMALATNGVFSTKSKHVDVRFHLVRDNVARGEVFLLYTPTEEMLADGFTKALDGPAFLKFREALGVQLVPE